MQQLSLQCKQGILAQTHCGWNGKLQAVCMILHLIPGWRSTADGIVWAALNLLFHGLAMFQVGNEQKLLN